MAWISLAASAEYLWHSDHGSEPSPTVRSIDTAKVYCCPACSVVTLIGRPYGTTYAHWPHQCCLENYLTSSPEDSLARTSAVQAMEQAWKDSALGFSLRLLASLAIFDRPSSSWKMCQPSLFEGSIASPPRWPRSGMTVGGTAYELTMWERRTSENAGGFIPTATAQDSVGSRNCTARRFSKKKHSTGTTLTDFVTLFPTPTANTYGTRNNGKRGDGTTFKTAGAPSLDTMARTGLWPTPMAGDGRKGGANQKFGRGNPTLSAQAGGKLNPVWVEALMGYPDGWSEAEDWTMGRPRKQVPPRPCATCGKTMYRKRFATRLEDPSRFAARRFCSLSCANTRVEVGYHGNSWRARQHLKDSCERCGLTEKLQAHHSDHDRSNNTSENIQTLCGYCHAWWHHETRRLGRTISGRAPCHE